MFKLLNYFTIREQQLDVEKDIDRHLMQYQHTCPLIIAQYYAYCREKNRNQTQKVSQALIIDKLAVIEDNLEANNLHQEDIVDHMVSNANMCDYLHHFLKNINSNK